MQYQIAYVWKKGICQIMILTIKADSWLKMFEVWVKEQNKSKVQYLTDVLNTRALPIQGNYSDEVASEQ